MRIYFCFAYCRLYMQNKNSFDFHCSFSVLFRVDEIDNYGVESCNQCYFFHYAVMHIPHDILKSKFQTGQQQFGIWFSCFKFQFHFFVFLFCLLALAVGAGIAVADAVSPSIFVDRINWCIFNIRLHSNLHKQDKFWLIGLRCWFDILFTNFVYLYVHLRQVPTTNFFF